MPEIANGTPDLLPRPDPTILTTEQLRREIGALRAILEARLDAGDKAVELLHEDVLRRLELGVSSVEAEIKAGAALREERLRSITERLADFGDEVKTRFQERDTRSEREARDNKTAVDAAFAAQKEAVAEQNKSIALANDKSEASFTKQIDQIVILIQTTNQAVSDKIDDLKEQFAALRLQVGNAASNQSGQQRGSLDTRVIFFTVIGLCLTALSVAAIIGAHL